MARNYYMSFTNHFLHKFMACSRGKMWLIELCCILTSSHKNSEMSLVDCCAGVIIISLKYTDYSSSLQKILREAIYINSRRGCKNMQQWQLVMERTGTRNPIIGYPQYQGRYFLLHFESYITVDFEKLLASIFELVHKSADFKNVNK